MSINSWISILTFNKGYGEAVAVAGRQWAPPMLHTQPCRSLHQTTDMNAHATLNYFEDLKKQNGKKIMSC